MADDRDITQLLHRVSAGERGAESELFEAIYGQLRAMARTMLWGERGDHSLQPTGLVHEAFLRIRGSRIDWQDRNHFFSVASRAMRRVLVDHARARLAKKRPPAGKRVNDAEELIYTSNDPVTVLLVDEALEVLASLDKRQSQIVEMRFFGGLTEEEIAELLGVSSRTVKREWRFARLWLLSRLSSSVPDQNQLGSE